jgi:hypothetical protein
MTATEAPSLVSDLKRITAPDRVISDPSELYVYDCDGFTIARSTPGAVVFPMNTEEVVAIVRLLAERDVQIVPRGSGTGLTGGCVAFENGVIVSTARMNKILKIDLENRVAHVEAGVRNTALSDAVSQLPLNVDIEADDVHDVHPNTSPSRDPVDGGAVAPIANCKLPLSSPRSGTIANCKSQAFRLAI